MGAPPVMRSSGVCFKEVPDFGIPVESNVPSVPEITENNLTSITDANSHTTSFQYDNFGRVTRTTFPSTLYETAAYDAIGNLTSKTDRKGNTTTYTYDALNRLTRKQYQDGSGVNYAYDALNRLTQATDATGTYGFAYDFMGRLTQTSTTYAFLTGRTFTVSYAYDAGSNRTSLTDAESGVTTYANDTLNRLTLLNNWLSQSFGFAYDVLGRRTALTRPNSVNTSYTYDDLSRLLTIVHARNGTTLDGASYTYGSAGERASRTNLRDSSVSSFTYDLVYQLTQATGSPTANYGYDAVGNMTAPPSGNTYGYNASNQIATVNGYTQFTHDLNGNMTSNALGLLTWSHTWNFEDRLAAATLGTFTTISFTYDPFGRRVKKSTSSSTTIYVYDGANIIEEVNSIGSEVARYTQGPNIDEPLAQLRSGATHYYEADGLGSVTSLTNNNGVIANRYSYSAFGGNAGTSGSVVNPFRYTAREFDTETQIYYYRARYYDQNLSRFISEDPARFRANGNFYVYVRNRSSWKKDPFGLQEPGEGKTWGPFTWYGNTTGMTVTEIAALVAHEGKHRDDFWNGNVFLKPCEILESGAFAEEIPVYQNRLRQFERSCKVLSVEEAREYQSVQTHLQEAIENSDPRSITIWVYCHRLPPAQPTPREHFMTGW